MINPETGAPETGVDAVKTALTILLMTRPGGRLLDRQFGSPLVDLIDRPNAVAIIQGAYGELAEAVATYEPRADLKLMSAQTKPGGTAFVTVRFEYEGRPSDVEVAP